MFVIPTGYSVNEVEADSLRKKKKKKSEHFLAFISFLPFLFFSQSHMEAFLTIKFLLIFLWGRTEREERPLTTAYEWPGLTAAGDACCRYLLRGEQRHSLRNCWISSQFLVVCLYSLRIFMVIQSLTRREIEERKRRKDGEREKERRRLTNIKWMKYIFFFLTISLWINKLNDTGKREKV